MEPKIVILHPVADGREKTVYDVQSAIPGWESRQFEGPTAWDNAAALCCILAGKPVPVKVS